MVQFLSWNICYVFCVLMNTVFLRFYAAFQHFWNLGWKNWLQTIVVINNEMTAAARELTVKHGIKWVCVCCVSWCAVTVGFSLTDIREDVCLNTGNVHQSKVFCLWTVTLPPLVQFCILLKLFFCSFSSILPFFLSSLGFFFPLISPKTIKHLFSLNLVFLSF